MRDESVLLFGVVCWLFAAFGLGVGGVPAFVVPAVIAAVLALATRSRALFVVASWLAIAAHAAFTMAQREAVPVPFGEARITAVVETAPLPIEPEAPWMRATPSPPIARALLRVTSVDDAPASFGVALTLPRHLRLLPGDRVVVSGELRAIPSAQWTYDRDPRVLGLRRGVHATIGVSTAELLEVVGRANDPLLRVRRWQALLGERLFGEAGGGGAAVALLFGDRRFLSREDEAAMASAGIVHVISVSGLHLTALGALAWLILRRGLRRSAGASTVVALTLVWAYALFSGSEAPALRSALMQSLAMLAGLTERDTSAKRTLGLALTALVAVWPEACREPAFAFSFVTMLALVVVVPRVPLFGPRWFRLLCGFVAASGIASIAAWPLSAFWFGSIAIAGVVTNLVAVPLTTFVMLPLGCVWLLGTATGHGTAIAQLLARCSDLLVWVAHGVPEMLVFDVWLRDHEVALAYVALAACTVRSLRRVALAGALGFAAAFLWPTLARHTSTALTLATLPVGQGDSHVLILPGGGVMVVDGGGVPDGRVDPGRRVLRPFLLTHRVRTIDAIVLTHAHPDHYGGLADVLEHFSVERFVWTGQGGSSTGMRHVTEVLRAARVSEDPPSALAMVGISVLHPLPEIFGELGLNDNSIVLHVRHAGRSILMMGDVEAIGEEMFTPPRADVLKVGHHGSHTSTTPAFLAAVRPSIAVISAGKHNPFGHPHADVLARLPRVLRTDRDGLVSVRIDADGTITCYTF